MDEIRDRYGTGKLQRATLLHSTDPQSPWLLDPFGT